jgi:hypothetical protein
LVQIAIESGTFQLNSVGKGNLGTDDHMNRTGKSQGWIAKHRTEIGGVRWLVIEPGGRNKREPLRRLITEYQSWFHGESHATTTKRWGRAHPR